MKSLARLRRGPRRRFDPAIVVIGLLLALHPAASGADGLFHGAVDFAAAAERADPSCVGIVGREAGTTRDRGAGFVWRGGDVVVTAAHVVTGTGTLRVRLADGREVAARRVGVDEVADVAVLRLDESLPPAELAPAGSLRRGDPVAAIGDPLAFAGTLTVGHVSSPARPWADAGPYDVVQHDAALNPGSSGGPLIDRGGRVVAMNIAIADGARRHVGIGFALPVATVERVVERLLRDGEVVRPRLGLRLRPAEALRGAIPSLGAGLVIEAVEPGSPAAEAGLTAGEVVGALDGRPVETPRDLARALETKRPGDVLAVDVGGGGGSRRAVVRLAAAPKPPVAVPSTEAAETFTPGFALAPDAPARIASLEPDGVAASAGLAVGDEILSIGDRRPDGSSGDALLARATGDAGSSGLALLVKRGVETRWVVLGPRGRLDAEAPFGSNAEALTSHTF